MLLGRAVVYRHSFMWVPGCWMYQCQEQVSAPLELELREQVLGLPGCRLLHSFLGEPCLNWTSGAAAGVVGGWGRGQGWVTVIGAG